MKETIYLDYNATTPLDPRVADAMAQCLTLEYGNPSSMYALGRSARALIDEARERVAALTGARPGELSFTGGGSESNNTAVKGTALRLATKGRHIITSAVEHASVMESTAFLERSGFEVTRLGVDSGGLIDPGELSDSIRDDTVLVSIIWANNETGSLMPVDRIGEVCRGRGVLFHSDAVQALGKVDIDLKELPVDMMSFSAHKLYGPKGVGALYVRSGFAPEPLIHGGGQERGRRSGTENVAGILGFGLACELMMGEMAGVNERVRGLRARLLEGLTRAVEGFTVNGGALVNTLNVSFEGVSGEALVMALDLEGIAVSTGSACSEGNVDASHVLLAMGLTEDQASGSVRFSLGRYTREEDIARVLEVLVRLLERIRLAGSG